MTLKVRLDPDQEGRGIPQPKKVFIYRKNNPFRWERKSLHLFEWFLIGKRQLVHRLILSFFLSLTLSFPISSTPIFFSSHSSLIPYLYHMLSWLSSHDTTIFMSTTTDFLHMSFKMSKFDLFIFICLLLLLLLLFLDLHRAFFFLFGLLMSLGLIAFIWFVFIRAYLYIFVISFLLLILRLSCMIWTYQIGDIILLDLGYLILISSLGLLDLGCILLLGLIFLLRAFCCTWAHFRHFLS